MAYIKSPTQAVAYLKFRPSPPKELIEKIVSFIKLEIKGPLEQAVDVGCGSGQSTGVLAPHFQRVLGLDSSEDQLKHAQLKSKHSNVSYRLGSAEDLKEPDSSVDLVSAGMAAHWFDLPRFYTEVGRVLRRGGALALYGYNFPCPGSKSSQADSLLTVVNNTLGLHIPEESKLAYFEGYKTTQFSHFPFSKDPVSRFEFPLTKPDVSVNEIVGYLSTMSAFQAYTAKHGEEAAYGLLSDIKDRLVEQLGDSSRTEDPVCGVTFPFFLLIGRKDS